MNTGFLRLVGFCATNLEISDVDNRQKFSRNETENSNHEEDAERRSEELFASTDLDTGTAATVFAIP